MVQKAHSEKVVVLKNSSLKSECFVKEGLNFKERLDLSVKFMNGQNEIQTCWTEIINDKKEQIF